MLISQHHNRRASLCPVGLSKPCCIVAQLTAKSWPGFTCFCLSSKHNTLLSVGICISPYVMALFLNQVLVLINVANIRTASRDVSVWPEIIFRTISSSTASSGSIFSSSPQPRSKIRSSASFTVCHLHIVALPEILTCRLRCLIYRPKNRN